MKSTIKYNANKALKGGQTRLPDELQKGIIDKKEKENPVELNESFRSLIQGALDIAGLIPGWGEIADGINVAISSYVGDAVSATLSAISMIPTVGDAIGKGGKLVLFGNSVSGNILTSVKDAITDENVERIANFLQVIDNRANTSMKTTWEDEILPQLIEKLNITAIAEGKTMSNKTTEQQIREHVRAAIKEIRESKQINEGGSATGLRAIGHGIRGLLGRGTLRYSRGISLKVIGRGAGMIVTPMGSALGTAGSPAMPATVTALGSVVPASPAVAAGGVATAVPVLIGLGIAGIAGIVGTGLWARREGNNANDRSNLNMAKSSINRAWTSSVNRRRGLGEESDAGVLEAHIEIMRNWRNGGNVTDQDMFLHALDRISKEDWLKSPIEEDPGGYGDVDDAQALLDDMIGTLPNEAKDDQFWERQTNLENQRIADAIEEALSSSQENEEPGEPGESDVEDEVFGTEEEFAAESAPLSEVRQHVRNAINEVMVGLTPITRMNTQGNAKKARKGNNTNTAVDKAELGFNTFDMQEWASIAGIDEKHLSEAIGDDTGNSSMLGGEDAPFDNVVDIGADEYDSTDEIPGMEVSPVSGDSSWDDGLEDEVEDLADEYIANRADPNVFDIRDFLAEIRKR